MNKAVISVLSTLMGAGAGSTVTSKVMGKKVDTWKCMSDKHLELFLMMNRWIKVKQAGKNLSEYFEQNKYKKIAIYGMSYAGETLIDELKGSGVEVLYGIDREIWGKYEEVSIVSPKDCLKNVDVVIVTAITFFDEIAEMLTAKMDCPIVSLETVLDEVMDA